MAKEKSSKPQSSDKMPDGPLPLHKALAMGKSYPGLGKAASGGKK